MVKRILVARTADTANLNAQAKNTQAILRYWTSTQYRPCVLADGEPDPAVAGNANVELLHLRHGRVWRADLFLKYMWSFDAIFYPGIHHRVDWLALRTRALLNRQIPVVSTIEGLIGSLDGNDDARTIAECAGHEIHCQKVESGQFRRVQAILNMADHIVAISPFLGRVANRLYGDKVSVLPLGVDVSLFRRTEWSRRPRLRVVSAGTFQGRKRPEMFVAVARRFPEADFVWFGAGPEPEQAAVLAQARDVPNLAFPGAVPPERLAREFAASDIFVMPSLSEGVPKSSQEAAASGLAQIIFGYYEAPSVVEGKNGFVVWSDEEFVGRLRQLLGDPDLVERMGRAGSDMATAWSWTKVAPQWERRIIEAVEGRLAGPGKALPANQAGQA